jgi:hypothetical protein
MVERGARDCPEVVCDACGKPIKDAESGNYMWRYGEGAVRFAHKGSCTVALEGAQPGHWGCDELQTFPIYLGNGLHLNWKKANGLVKILGNLRL